MIPLNGLPGRLKEGRCAPAVAATTLAATCVPAMTGSTWIAAVALTPQGPLMRSGSASEDALMGGIE